ncbi:hypothetical protein [Cryptosporangium sp. NPDC051539]|uniref:hypothetical protein n=1 Tax=Cryptosporangium sp. NPDC051539 TaxID=3363962 RepID=UPI003795F2F7
MTTGLEHELEAAMRAHVAGARVTTDLLTRAARAERKRLVARRTAFVAGSLGLAAAVTGVVALSGPENPAPAPAPELRPAGYVAAQVTDSIERSATKITAVSVRQTADATTTRSEQWWDGKTGNWRRHSAGGDSLITYTGGRATFTVVDHTTKSWWAISYQADPNEGGLWTKEDLRAALKKDSGLEVVGPETVDGRRVIHLRVAKNPKGVNLELWADATSYDLVRTVEEDPHGGVSQWDYTFLPRTERDLARFALDIPPGYTRNQADAPQKSNAEPAN